jgi:putative peptidoglycan lipid II flippase
MVRRILGVFFREYRGLHEAAFLLGLSAFSAQLLALVRDRLLATNFGAGQTLDVYYAAFRLPDFIYVLVGSFVSVNVLVPFIAERLAGTGEKGEVRRLLGPIALFFGIVVFCFALLAFFLLPYVTPFLVPGFSAEATREFIDLSRILLLSPILLGFSNLLGSVTQSLRRFFVYALSPILYNIGIIFGIIALFPKYGLRGIAFGVIVGAFLHAAIQIPTVLRSGFFPKPKEFFGSLKVVKKVAALSLPRTIALGTQQIMVMFFIAMASSMTAGSIAVFNFAYNLQSVPLALIGVSYSMAAFPTLSRLFAEGERKQFVRYISIAARHIMFWSLPAAALFIILRAQIVRTLLGAGAFSWQDTRLVAAVFAIFSISVVAQSLVLLFVRGYYAAGKTKKPLLVNILSLLVSVASAPWFLYLFKTNDSFREFISEIFRVGDLLHTEVLALPLAFSLGSLLNLFLLSALFKRDFKEDYISLRRTLAESFGAALLAGFVAYQGLRVFDNIYDLTTVGGVFLQGLLAGVLGIIAAVFFLFFIKNKELGEVRGVATSRLWAKPPVLPSPEENINT